MWHAEYGNSKTIHHGIPKLETLKDFQHLEKLVIYFHKTKRNISDNDLNQLRAMLPNTEVEVTGGGGG